MQPKQGNIRWNVLGLGAIGAALVAVLALATSGEAQLATFAVAGGLIGGFSGVMVRLTEPDPDPSVPSSLVVRLLDALGPAPAVSDTVQAEMQAVPPAWRPNVLLLVGLGAVLVGLMMVILPQEGAIVTVGGAFIGGLTSLAGRLVDPPPDPAVPVSLAMRLLDGLPAPRTVD